MASNEHAYLSEPNLHNPKGLSLASNDTLCSKGNSGQLEWVSKSYIKTDTVMSTGYCTLAANYKYAESQVQGQSPYDMNQDYGSPTISSATTVLQKKFFKIANFGLCMDGVINRCVIQVTNNQSSNPFTVALVKYTPSNTNTQAYPVVLFEKEVSGNTSQDKVFTTDLSVSSDAFTNTAISKGDHIFIMAKGIVSGERSTSIGNLAQMSVMTEIGYSTN
tara:strand:- start:1024 stop:1680 length:657 start_codon:yes stop_codon:yes gene_type:complete